MTTRRKKIRRQRERGPGRPGVVIFSNVPLGGGQHTSETPALVQHVRTLYVRSCPDISPYASFTNPAWTYAESSQYTGAGPSGGSGDVNSNGHSVTSTIFSVTSNIASDYAYMADLGVILTRPTRIDKSLSLVIPTEALDPCTHVTVTYTATVAISLTIAFPPAHPPAGMPAVATWITDGHDLAATGGFDVGVGAGPVKDPSSFTDSFTQTYTRPVGDPFGFDLTAYHSVRGWDYLDIHAFYHHGQNGSSMSGSVTGFALALAP